MCGGQAIDLAAVGLPMSASELETMHRMKTGALLRASITMGAAAGRVPALERAALERYADAVGLAFQIVDDLLDAVATSAELGKTAGKDQRQSKPTYVSVLGTEARGAGRSGCASTRTTLCPASGPRLSREPCGSDSWPTLSCNAGADRVQPAANH